MFRVLIIGAVLVLLQSTKLLSENAPDLTDRKRINHLTIIDKRKLKKFKQGNEKVFEEIYDLFGSKVYGLILRYIPSKDEANDVFQDTFLKAYEHRSSFDPTYPFWPWIKQIARNSALTHIRKNCKLVHSDLDVFEKTISHDEPIDFLEKDKKDLKEILLHILGKMPIGYRTVFNLFMIDNLTHKEIAQVLDITENNSRSQLHKAKKMVQKLLNEYEEFRR